MENELILKNNFHYIRRSQCIFTKRRTFTYILRTICIHTPVYVQLFILVMVPNIANYYHLHEKKCIGFYVIFSIIHSAV